MAGRAGKFLKGCLLAAAGLALLFVLLVAAAVGWGLYANGVADREAKAFCEATRPGEEIAYLLERARADNTMKRHYELDGAQHFYWQGGIFYAAECEVKNAGGRVASARQVTHDD